MDLDLLPRMESLSPLSMPLGISAEFDPEKYGRIIKVGVFWCSLVGIKKKITVD